mmetsp:Transcript_4075/g.8780  ORF Transcript_4075/g.8780 Transcript_4075/m.8780 type:complete len:83 (+) Transcript_4075:853-1101(+)
MLSERWCEPISLSLACNAAISFRRAAIDATESLRTKLLSAGTRLLPPPPTARTPTCAPPRPPPLLQPLPTVGGCHDVSPVRV